MNIKDSFIIEHNRFNDKRGSFFELHKDSLTTLRFVQDNISYSVKNTLRGMHTQKINSQGKLVTCLSGEIYDVAIDLRLNSPTFMKWQAVSLKDGDKSFYIPPGCAHGFFSVTDSIVHYKCTTEYDKLSDGGIKWDDPVINVTWPQAKYIISDKDNNLPYLGEYLGQCQAV